MGETGRRRAGGGLCKARVPPLRPFVFVPSLNVLKGHS